MNTQVGKSVGIALLLAAGLIAALFAMGVFAPGGADAAVKATPAPKADLTSQKPGAEDVTLTLTFEVNDDVDGAAPGGGDDYIAITLAPHTFTDTNATVDLDNITVTQNGTEVGGVQYARTTYKSTGENSVTIHAAVDEIRLIPPPTAGTAGVAGYANPPAAPDAGLVVRKGIGNPVLRANAPVVVTITGLDNNATAAAYNITIAQQSGSTASADQTANLNITPSVTEATVALDSTDQSTPPKGDYDAEATPVKMTITLETDTDAATPAADGSKVVITLPSAYDLDMGDDDGTTDNPHGVDEVSATDATPKYTITPSGGEIAVADDGESIDVFGFDAGDTVTVTISGLTNPSTSGKHKVEFKQGNIPATGGIQQTEMFYITLAGEEDVTDLMLTDRYAGGTGTMSFMFEAIQNVMDDDSKVMVTLDDAFTGFSTGNVMVQKKGSGDTYEDVGGVMSGMDNMFYITKADIASDNISDGDMVKVTISDLTNPPDVATRVSEPVKVKQGGFKEGKTDLGLITHGAMLSDTQAGAENVRLTIGSHAEVALDGDLSDEVVVSLPGFEVPTDINLAQIRVASSTDGRVTLSDAEVVGNDIILTLDGGEMIEEGEDYSITFREHVGLINPASVGTTTITVADQDDEDHEIDLEITRAPVVPGVTPKVEISSYKADTSVEMTVFARAENRIRGGNDIVIDMDGFQVPATIDEEEVIVTGPGTSFYGNPASVAVSGSNVTVTIPTKIIGQGGAHVDTEISSGDYTIFFKKNAGLKTPNSSGTKTIEVTDADATDHELTVDIISHISVDPGWVMRGDEFKVTGKGINAVGDSTVHLYTGTVPRGGPGALTNLDLVESSVSLVLGRSLRDGGTVIVEGIDTTHSDFVADAIDATRDADAKGYNLIVMVDAAGNNVGHTYLGILPTVTLDVTDVRRTGQVVVSVSDWYYGRITDAHINGIQVNLPDNECDPHDPDTAPDDWCRGYYVGINNDKTATFTVVVDRDVRLGEMEVRLEGSTRVKQGSNTTLDIHKQTVNVGFFDLTITPSTAVTDQVIRIEGTGFGANVCIEEITVGEEHIEEATTGDRVVVGSNTSNCVLTDSDGDVANSFKVPYNLKPDDYKVVVRDVNNRVGEAVLTVPKPAITLSPEASQRGSTVTVTGENFPAQDVIGITYGGDTVTVATTDTVGKWRATFKVPVDSTIGREYEVVAQSDKKGDGEQTGPTTPPKRANLNAKATHTVPEETLKVWPQGQAEPPDDSTVEPAIASGGRLQVKATNLPPHTTVSLLIGDIAVAGRVLGEEAAADSAGRYTDSVLVPQLTPGTHTVELKVHTIGSDVVVVTFVNILDITTRPTTDVFEDLIAAGQLVVVWHYDNATGTWSAYDPKVPPEINDLNLLSTGDIVWVEVNESVVFQGQTLRAGASLISLD